MHKITNIFHFPETGRDLMQNESVSVTMRQIQHSNTAAAIVQYSRLRMAPINLRTSHISPINYTASVERTPINVKHRNRFK